MPYYLPIPHEKKTVKRKKIQHPDWIPGLYITCGPVQSSPVQSTVQSSPRSRFYIHPVEPLKYPDELTGLELEPALVEPDGDGRIKLPVRNVAANPIFLETGQVMGSAQTVEVVQRSASDNVDEEGVSDVSVSVSANLLSVTIPELTEERRRELCKALQMEKSRLTLEQRDAMVKLLLEFHDVFALNNLELGVTDVVQHTIETGDQPPVRQYARRVPYALRGRIAELLDDMLSRGVIQPTKSPWGSPIVLVAKWDGSLRFCVDYRKLNQVTKKDVYPMPRIEDYLDVLTGQHYFSTLDLCT